MVPKGLRPPRRGNRSGRDRWGGQGSSLLAQRVRNRVACLPLPLLLLLLLGMDVSLVERRKRGGGGGVSGVSARV